ncbi:MAG: hypothetical protein PF693_11005 [Spirochaetia bacterium]|nr:hypothetical protein [Spirochaetia bacterium]
MSVDEYLHQMDIPGTQNAVTVAGMPKEIMAWIWEEEKLDGLVWLS